MILFSCEALGKVVGDRPLFEALSFGLFEGDQLGLVGPNGSGKSTLLKIVAGLESADTGRCSFRSGLRLGHVPQDPVFAAGATVDDIIAAALTAVDEAERPGRLALARGRAGFGDGSALVDTLSGGWRKRLAIARELAAGPDVLLLDEPTNHLDLDGILWLESVLAERARACVVVSHDRWFLEHVATRMLELNRAYPGGLFACDGGYSEFLARRDDILRGQAAYEESLANVVRQEIAWLRRGAKARSTKARGRIREAGRRIDELAAVQARTAAPVAGIELTASGRRTRRLIDARGLGASIGGRTLFRGLELTIGRGTRVGLMGPNGSGKTTLLDVLAGAREPDAGTVEHAVGLRVVRFTQGRGGLDPTLPLRRALAADGDAVTFQGRAVHVASWAKRFLFLPEQLDVPVGRLSGGEQARILIARLMGEPADVLLLDEPTNDLDIATLEVLEESLVAFDGGLVLVTHDRLMLERVCTSIVALDGAGGVGLFADYAQWEHASRRAPPPVPAPAATPVPRARSRQHRLGYLEQREWDGMERAVLDAEAVVHACRRAAEHPSIASDPAALQARHAELEAAQAVVDRLYARWAELEAKQLADGATGSR